MSFPMDPSIMCITDETCRGRIIWLRISRSHWGGLSLALFKECPQPDTPEREAMASLHLDPCFADQSRVVIWDEMHDPERDNGQTIQLVQSIDHWNPTRHEARASDAHEQEALSSLLSQALRATPASWERSSQQQVQSQEPGGEELAPLLQEQFLPWHQQQVRALYQQMQHALDKAHARIRELEEALSKRDASLAIADKVERDLICELDACKARYERVQQELTDLEEQRHCWRGRMQFLELVTRDYQERYQQLVQQGQQYEGEGKEQQ